MTYQDKWYKVYFKRTTYDGTEYITFEYGFGDDQVKRLIERFDAVRVEEWVI